MRFIFALFAVLLANAANGQTARVVSNCGASVGYTAGVTREMVQDVNGLQCNAIAPYGAGVTPIAGNASGTTGAVVGTLASAAAQTAYICGFSVQALGTANSIGPVVIAGMIGSPQTYQSGILAAGVVQQINQSFNPCIPASAVNTNITITTTAAAGATAVNVNSWGFRQ